MFLTFICPRCLTRAALYEIEIGVVAQRICTGKWFQDDNPETAFEETCFDNSERTYECGNCKAEPNIDFSGGETLRSWVARHQSDPPGLLKDFLSVTQQIEVNEKQQLDPGPMTATVTPPITPEEPTGNPDLLP